MKLSFDSLLLWIIPYLYLLSLAYYFGYWGELGIDIFNYYGVQDLIKGVTYPLGTTAFATMVAGIFGPFVYLLTKWIDKGSWVPPVVILSVAVCLQLFGIVDFIHPPKATYYDELEKYYNTSKLVFMGIGISSAALLSSFVLERAGMSLSGFNRYAAFVITFFFVFLPFASFHEGRENSWLISKNYKFDYIRNTIHQEPLDSVRNPIIKYLGKAGEHHFFISLNNNQYVVIPASEIKALIVDYYDELDSASVRRFKTANKRKKPTAIPTLSQSLQPAPPSAR